MNKTIKNSLALAFCLLVQSTWAQVPIIVKTIDQDALLKGKQWRLVDAGMSNANEPYITFGQPSCDVDKSVDASSVTYTYKGVSWNFNRFFFDKKLDLQRTEEKSFGSTTESMQYANIWGKTFFAVPAAANGTLVGMSKSIVGGTGGLQTTPLTVDYLGKISVASEIAGFAFKLSRSRILGVTTGGDEKNPTSCWESPGFFKIDDQPAKEEKGQRWIPQFNDPVPGGGNVLFATSGVINEPGKGHYIFRKYDENLLVVAEEVIAFDYVASHKTSVLTRADGGKDYVMIAYTINYKDKNIKPGQPLDLEYIRIDGNTLKVKERFKFQSNFTKWTPMSIVEKDGAVYMFGYCSGSKTELLDFKPLPLTKKEFPNIQLIKISGGKADYVAVTSLEEFASKLKVLEGFKDKVEPQGILDFNKSAAGPMGIQVDVVNGNYIVSGQQLKNGTDRSAQMTLQFNAQGKLEAAYARPCDANAFANLLYSKDGNTAYWVMYDYTKHNLVDANYLLAAKKFPFIAAELILAKINLTNKTISAPQFIGTEEYAPLYGKEILFNSDTHLAIAARSLAKKAKDSDLTLVMFEK